jgi:hypothetical protein
MECPSSEGFRRNVHRRLSRTPGGFPPLVEILSATRGVLLTEPESSIQSVFQ